MKNILFFVPPLAYMLLIFELSLRPMPGFAPGVQGIDKLYHLAGYAVMGLLWARALAKGRVKGVYGNRIIIVSFMISFLFGVFIEVCQAYAPPREGDVFDAVANGLGAIGGAGVFSWYVRRRETLRCS
ncbi:MAG: VanZ family protein [Deltaproteobacteria bacterium]|nr:VanZ family protein [Deltaproteobacteria bacterium]